MADWSARIAAASADAGALLAICIELAQDNARLAAEAAILERRRLSEAGRKRKQRHGTSRDVTGQDVTGQDSAGPPPPSPSSSFPEPHITPSSPPAPASSSSSAVEFDAVAALLARIPDNSRPAWQAELVHAQTGMHGLRLSAEQIQTACRDYLGNQNDGQRSLRHFRGYLRSIATAPPARADRPTLSTVTRPAENGEAGKVFAAIRALMRETPNPGRGMIRSIPKSDVAALGDAALEAYEQIGGAERFLDPDEKVGFVLRDFTAAYRAASSHARQSA